MNPYYNDELETRWSAVGTMRGRHANLGRAVRQRRWRGHRAAEGRDLDIRPEADQGGDPRSVPASLGAAGVARL